MILMISERGALIRSLVKFVSGFVVLSGLVLICVFMGQTEVFAACDNCQYGCTTDCSTKGCNGDCHCCQTVWNCGCYNCGNCSCNPPPPPPPCTPGCSCTPVCPPGTSTNNTGPYCDRGRKSCSCTDDCGDRHTHRSDPHCYDPETNVAPSAPERIYFCVGGVAAGNCIELSQDPANRTWIEMPAAGSAVYIMTSTVGIPAGSNSRGMRYYQRVDYQNDGSWACANANDVCEGPKVEHYTTNIRNSIGLAEGVNYRAWGHSRTINRCDDGGKNSVAVHGYFRINNTPRVVSVIPSSGLSGNEPDEDPSSTCDDHNPQVFTVTYSDGNGCNDMSTTGLWMDGSSPEIRELHSSMHGAAFRKSVITIYASGTPHVGVYPNMDLLIDGKVVRTFTGISSYASYTYTHATAISADRVRVAFTNDSSGGGEDRNLRVDKVNIDGVNYESEAGTTWSLGSWSAGSCGGGFKGSEWLNCNGYFQYRGTDVNAEWKMYGTSCDASHGQTCGSETGCDCYKNYDWDIPSSGFNVPRASLSICSPDSSSSHTDRSSGCTADNTPVGWTITDMRCSGNSLSVDWKVWFYDENVGPFSNTYGYVNDAMSARDGWDDVGNWTLDLVAPDTTVDIEHQFGVGDPADSLHFLQRAVDERSADSGLRRIYGRYYDIERGSSTIQCDIGDGDCSSPNGDPVNLSGGPARWLVSSKQDDMRTGFEGGDEVSAQIVAEDIACNLSTDPVIQAPQIGHEWMQTKFYDTYAALGYNDPIQPSNVPFSTYWTGGNVSTPWNFGSGIASLKDWQSTGYDDTNSEIDWYDRLYGLAVRSEWSVNHDIQEISSLSQVTGDGIFEYTPSGTLTIGSSWDCDGVRVLFVPNASVEVEPGVDTTGDEYACLIVSGGDVTILDGSNASGADNEEVVELAFILNGTFTTEWDSNFDKLKIRGFVFAGNTAFERDLVFEANMSDPAEKIVHDPRYIYLLRDMLGRRPFDQFECGTVTGSDLCLGW